MNNPIQKSPILISFLLSFVSCLNAQWEATNGPYGGLLREIYSFGGQLYTTDGITIYSSADSATTWQKLPIVPSANISSIHKNDSHLLISSSQGVFITTDEGKSWNSRTNGIIYERWPRDSAVRGLLVHNDTLICYNDHGIYSSVDFGQQSG